jgi:ankyrin repeat protein
MYFGCPLEAFPRLIVVNRFLWVAFQIEDICEQSCDDDIRRVITTLPKGLRETYERILQRIGMRGRAGLAEKVFRWTAAERRPLTVDELHEAVAVEPGQESFRRDRMANGFEAHMVAWCGRLVTVDEETRAVQFAHPSVKQFLRSDDAAAATRADVERFLVRADEADTEVGEVCVTYLCFSDFDQRLVQMSKLDLSVDPAALVSTSLAASGSAGVAKGLEKLGRWRKKSPVPAAKLDSLVKAADFLRLERAQATRHPFAFLAYASENWLAHTGRLTERAPAWHGFVRLVLEGDHFAGLWRRLEFERDRKCLARDIAEHNQLALLSTLRRFRPPWVAGQLDDIFQACCEKRVLELATMCLDIAEDLGHVNSDWLLLTTVWDAPDLTRRLTPTGVATYTLNEKFNTALFLAVRSGLTDTVQVLLAAGAMSHVGINDTALFRAALERKDMAIFEMLIASKPKFLDHWVGEPTFLRMAANAGRVHLVEKLVAMGADISGNEIRNDGSTLLIAAIEGHRFTLARRLVNLGADVNLPAPHDGRTALQAAARAGDLATVTTLLKAQADVNARPAKFGGRTALGTAVHHGHHAIIACLLDAGAEVNAWSKMVFEVSSLKGLADPSRLDLLERLVIAGAQVPGDAVRCSGSPSLIAAIDELQSRLARQQLRGEWANNQLKSNGRNSPTALQAAASVGNLLLLQRLLRAGADVHATSPWHRGQTALYTAVQYGNPDVIEALLDAKARVNAAPPPTVAKAVWKRFAAENRLVLVERLFFAGFRITGDEEWCSGRTLLEAAHQAGRMEFVGHLVHAGADVYAPT